MCVALEMGLACVCDIGNGFSLCVWHWKWFQLVCVALEMGLACVCDIGNGFSMCVWHWKWV